MTVRSGDRAAGMDGFVTDKNDALEWIDGNMPFSPRFGDHFYAREDGRAESAHVFLGHNGLPERWQDGKDFTVGELGFGTGLNLLETWRQWIGARRDGQRLAFVSFEAFPMRADDIRMAISRWPDLLPLCEVFLAQWPEQPDGLVSIALDGQTTAEIRIGPAHDGVLGWQGRADAWYLDGFAPARNPEMWSAGLIAAVAAHTAPGGTFATYTAAGWVRRNLEAAGFSVEKLPGHGRKREMLAGRLVSGA